MAVWYLYRHCVMGIGEAGHRAAGIGQQILKMARGKDDDATLSHGMVRGRSDLVKRVVREMADPFLPVFAGGVSRGEPGW